LVESGSLQRVNWILICRRDLNFLLSMNNERRKDQLLFIEQFHDLWKDL
jgi:hypothetical protein